jgi:hypothetical protein
VPFVDPGVLLERVARMQVERQPEPLNGLPEGPVLRQIVEDRAVNTLTFAEPVDESTNKSQVSYAALQLDGCHLRVLHRQGGKGSKAFWVTCNLLSKRIVRTACNLKCLRRLGDGLDRRSVERHDHHLYTVLVHLLKPAVRCLQETPFEFRPVLRWTKRGSILHCI